MAADSPADDQDPDANEDPWADIIADGLSADDDGSAFDFSSLDDPAPAGIAPPTPSESDESAAVDPEDLFADVTADASVPGREDDGLRDEFRAENILAESVVSEEFRADEALAEDALADEALADEALADEALADEALADEALADEAAGDLLAALAADESRDDTASAAEASGTIDVGFGSDDGDAPSVFQSDDAEPEGSQPSSTVEIGTGFSGLDLGSGSTADDEGLSGDDTFSDAFAEQLPDVSTEFQPGGETDDTDLAALGAAVAGGATAAAVVATDRPPRRATAKSKKGGAGQMLGIVLGGALSLPIVGLILIGVMWLGGPDSLGMRRWLPGASFLLPPRKAAPAGGGQAKTLDDLSAAGGSVPAPTAGAAPPDAFAVATAAVDADSPAPQTPDIDTAEPAAPAEPAAEPPAAEPPMAADPIAALAVPEIDVPVATPDLLAAIPAVPPLDADLLQPPAPPSDPEAGPGLVPAPVPAPPAPEPPAPEPLDVARLDAAVDAAVDAAARLADDSGGGDRERARRLVNWYRTLATIGEELAALEVAAGARGLPFAEVAPHLDPVIEAIAPDGPLAADLPRLARNWLTFSRRDRDGVVLPATFASTRQVGPYWCSTVRIAEADGTTRDLAIVSRRRPTAAADSRCVVLGVLFDGGVVWAADVRGEDGSVVLESGGDADVPSSEASVGAVAP